MLSNKDWSEKWQCNLQWFTDYMEHQNSISIYFQRLIPGPLVDSKAVEKAYDEKMNKMALNFEMGRNPPNKELTV